MKSQVAVAKLENDTKYVDLTLKKVTKYLIDWECKKPLKDGKGEVKKKKKKETSRVHEQTCISERAARFVLHV